MRFLHTADWHLGKSLKGQNLLDDQEYIIKEILKVIDDTKPKAILIAGDIYDRAVPPANAVELFNETLNRFAEKKLPTLIIAGNHDSAARLNFGSKLFESKNIFIASKVNKPINIPLKDNFGEIYFSLIPFFEPGEIRTKFFDENSAKLNYNDANKFYIELARENIPAGKRSIAIAHAFISGNEKTNSVRDIVGCAEGISAEIFSDYDYVALGHLHSPRSAGKNLYYSGSPLKYSFDEANHKKSVTIVDIDGSGNVEVNPIKLKPRRDLVIVNGTFKELVKHEPIQDYVQIILTDDTYIYETERLREAFPNFLEIKRESHLKSYDEMSQNNFRKEDSISEQFAKFFESVTNEPLTEDEREAFEEVLKEVEREERE